MNKIFGVMIAAGLMVGSMSIMASAETGVLTNPVPVCKKRDTAFSATLTVALAQGQNASKDTIDKALSDVGCFYANKRDMKFKIHSKTKDTVKGTVVHYAQVSLISVGDNIMSEELQSNKMWIAGPYQNDGQTNMLKLDNGKFW